MSTFPDARPDLRPCSRASCCSSSASRTKTWPSAGEEIPLSSAETEEQQAPEVDSVRQQLLDELTEALGDAVVGSHIHAGDLWIRVRREDWRRTAETCRRLGFDYFDFLSGIDWMPS